MTRMKAMVIAVVLLAGGSAAAHEQRFHKGRATEGDVVSVSKDGLVMRTEKGSVTVTFQDSTRVERGDEKVDRDMIHEGAHVSVLGTTLASGELVAREVLIKAPHGHEGHVGGHDE